MGDGSPAEQTHPMLTPIVIEIPRVLEPIARDTFIGARRTLTAKHAVRLPSR
jgi:hypothetical protein